MLTDFISMAMLFFSIIIIAYHHIGYPLLLHRLAIAKRSAVRVAAQPHAVADPALPTVTLIVPVHNEAAVIEAKIENMAALDYPARLLSIVIALDGCTDGTSEMVKRAIERGCAGLEFRILEYPYCRGKVAVLNDCIALARTELIALTDASASIEPQALCRTAHRFSDPAIGVVCAAYQLVAAGGEGERAYWKYQTQIKLDESTLAAPMGAHGAFYAFRRRLWQPLPEDTINDDFVVPMRIVMNGARAIYDPSIVATELEPTTSQQEYRRRVRIGAGNIQQAIRLFSLAAPWRGWVAFLFVSGKGLRPFISGLALIALFTSAQLTWSRGPPYFAIYVAALVVSIALTFYPVKGRALPKSLLWVSYLVRGHLASFIGAGGYLTGWHRGPWIKAHPKPKRGCSENYICLRVACVKRGCDIALALIALPLLSALLIPIAMAIKLTSKGPVFYRQLRVGRSTAASAHTFELIKFRTMRDHAETNGPVLAAANDPRVTPIGRILRRTHLDELPQLINVLKGDMSIVGPRPERPSFTQEFENSIPFYADRTFGLRPGITGLAQIHINYDTCLEDVRQKVMYDHVYAARLNNLRGWLATDVYVLFKTLILVFKLKGH